MTDRQLIIFGIIYLEIRIIKIYLLGISLARFGSNQGWNSQVVWPKKIWAGNSKLRGGIWRGYVGRYQLNINCIHSLH